jgi:hypothetical protein
MLPILNFVQLGFKFSFVNYGTTGNINLNTVNRNITIIGFENHHLGDIIL